MFCRFILASFAQRRLEKGQQDVNPRVRINAGTGSSRAARHASFPEDSLSAELLLSSALTVSMTLVRREITRVA